MSDLLAWLERHGRAKYHAAFTENEIELGDLAELSDADLRELGNAGDWMCRRSALHLKNHQQSQIEHHLTDLLDSTHTIAGVSSETSNDLPREDYTRSPYEKDQC